MKLVEIPLKEVRIRDLRKTTIEELTKTQAIEQTPHLFWCNGFLYFVSEYAEEEFAYKQMDGILYLYEFVYAECPEKITQSKWNGYCVEVVDQTGFKWIEEIIDAIKGGQQ